MSQIVAVKKQVFRRPQKWKRWAALFLMAWGGPLSSRAENISQSVSCQSRLSSSVRSSLASYRSVDLEKQVRENRRVIRWNLFFTSRGLADYKQSLHPDFEKSLGALSSSDIWMDLGAGKALAAEEFLKTGPLSSKPLVIAVTYSLGWFRRPPSLAGRLKILEGRLLEDIPSSELPQASLMTDVFGVLSYTDRLSESLNQIFAHLKKQGELFVYFRTYSTTIETDSGTISLDRFLSLIPGIEVEGRNGTLKIKKIIDDPILVPKLELIQINHKDRPAFRRFRVIESNPQ
jgi:hypothetical protein